jgi:hypothetical protein
VVFVAILLILAIFFSTPTPFQYLVFKTVLSLAAAGIAAMVPGFLQVSLATWLRAGGALAVFVIVYFYNPAHLVVSEPAQVSIGQADEVTIDQPDEVTVDKPDKVTVDQTDQVLIDQPAQVLVGHQKTDSKVQFVDHSVTYPESDALVPEIDLKLRNTGDQVAYIKKLGIDVLGEATFEDCRQPSYSLTLASAEYDIDILGSRSKEISHSIKPADVDRIKVRVFRPTGGPTLTVYKVALNVVYDEDNKVTASSVPIFLKMSGPSVPEAMFTPGVSEEEWNACVDRNRTEFRKIGYKIYEDDPS